MPASIPMEKHLDDLRAAVAAARSREHHSRYPEYVKDLVYGEDPVGSGLAAFEVLVAGPLELDQPSTGGWVPAESSTYGLPLAVRYPEVVVDDLVDAARAALPPWREVGADVRAAVCVEILDRLGARAHELGHAVMHTTGQGFAMAFQAGATHALDRGLEAVAYAWDAQTRHASQVRWVKPGKRPLVMDKQFHVVPRGVAVTIGVRTFPTWNGFPGIFASLATGNPVIVKPHPSSVLPLALTVQVAQEVLADAGLPPQLVQLAAEQPDAPLATDLATHPDVRLVDFTGSSEFGEWLEEHARQALVFTEKSGVNPLVVDGTDDAAGMFANLAFSLSLYSGQMCTTPQAIFVPRGGIDTDEGHLDFDEVGARLGRAIDELLGPPERAVEILGAMGDPVMLSRLEEAESLGDVVLASRPVAHPRFPDAIVRTPLVVAVDVADVKAYDQERFGPISFLVATSSTEESLAMVRDLVPRRGAITFGVWSRDQQVRAAATQVALDVALSVSFDLTGQVYVNQTAAFSDFHATGANPAANASLVDDWYVTGRFRIVETRSHPSDPGEEA